MSRVAPDWELALLQRRLDELLERLAPGREPEPAWAPPVDIVELPDRLIVRVDLPGVRAANLALSMRGERLRVAGRKPPAPRPGARCHRLERSFGPFLLELPLPGPLRPAEAGAVLRAGVLEVSIPRCTEARGAALTITIREEEP